MRSTETNESRLLRSDSLRVGGPEDETEGVDALFSLVEVTIQADDFLSLRNLLSLPVTVWRLKHRVVVPGRVLNSETVDLHLSGKLDTDFSDGYGLLLAGRRHYVEHELLEDVRLRAIASVKGLTADIVREVELDAAQRGPVRADALQLNLSVKIPVADLILSRPLKRKLAIRADSLSKRGHLLKAGLPLADDIRVVEGELLLHPHGLVLSQELLLHLALCLHERLDLLLDEVVKLSLLVKKLRTILDLCLNELLELRDIAGEAGTELIVVRLDRWGITLAVFLKRRVKVADKGLNRASNTDKLFASVSDFFNLLTKFLLLLGCISHLVFGVSTFKASHDSVKNHALNLIFSDHLFLGTDDFFLGKACSPARHSSSLRGIRLVVILAGAHRRSIETLLAASHCALFFNY